MKISDWIEKDRKCDSRIERTLFLVLTSLGVAEIMAMKEIENILSILSICKALHFH